jgi:hypothetical protein
MIIKLTKKEKDFLINWLSDDLDIARKDFATSSQDMFPPTLKNLKSIIKKLTKEQ